MANNKRGNLSKIGKKAANTASFLLMGRFLSIVLLGISLIVVARILGPSVYGIYTLSMGVVGFFGAAGNFGISTALNKFISERIGRNDRKGAGKLWFNSMVTIFALGLVITIIMVASSPLMSRTILHSGSYSYLLEIASLTILAGMLFDASYSSLIGFGNSQYLTVAAVVQSLVQSLASISFALLGFEAAAPILGLLIGFITGFILVSAIVLFRLKIPVAPTISLAEIRRLLEFSIPLAVSNVLMSISNNFALMVLGIYAVPLVAGNFGLASKMSVLLDLVTGSIYLASISMFSTALSRLKNNKGISELYNYMVYVAFLFVIPILFYIAVFSKQFSYTVFGGVYTLAPLYIRLSVLGLLVGFFGYYAGSLLISANKVRDMLKYTTVIFLVEMLSIPLLIPSFKGVGLVVIQFFISSILIDIMYLRKIIRDFNVRINIRKHLRVLAANMAVIPLLLVIMLLSSNNYILMLILSAFAEVLIYPVMLGVLHAVTQSDIDNINKAADGIPLVSNVMKIFLYYVSIFSS
ncbi:MAG: oligosaccharide flippase family protein [Candidatus Marsarchaeota archaeon]|nr:oligosaccharide flippase family protein [Candidatus Marsarchaeota archaeon]